MSTKAGKKGHPTVPRTSPKCTLETIDDVHTYYEEKFKQYDEKFKLLEVKSQAQVDTLHKIIEKKDVVIQKLCEDIGDLKKSFDYMSKETADIKEKLDTSNTALKSKLQEAESEMKSVMEKTVDLEDRSRRSNLVFFNFKEASQGITEDCEDMVDNLLKSLNILGSEDIWIDRAHRLGRRKPENDTKPRPIIVKFSYYKQKEKIIKIGARFKDCPINVSEDFSKETLKYHAQLRNYGKDAKERLFVNNTQAIKHYKVTYRRLVLTYTTDKNKPTAPTFTKSFSLNDIQEKANWFIPLKHNERSNS